MRTPPMTHIGNPSVTEVPMSVTTKNSPKPIAETSA